MPENYVLRLRYSSNAITPVARESKECRALLEKRIDMRFTTFEQKMDARFEALMSAIAAWKQAELTNTRVIAALSERVAVLEAQRH